MSLRALSCHTAEPDASDERATKQLQQAAAAAPAVAAQPPAGGLNSAQAPATAGAGGHQAGAAPAPVKAAPNEQQQQQALAGATVAADLAAAVRRSASTQSLPDAQRRKGTATNDKWAQYAGAAGARPRHRCRQRSVSAGETLHAAVRSTSRLRLLLAALLALLLASRWDAAAMDGGTSGGIAAAGKDRSMPAAQPASAGSQAPEGPWAGLQARWQAAMQQTRAAAAAVLPPFRGLKAQRPEAAAKRADSWSRMLAGVASRLEGHLAAAAASPAGQKVAAALLVARRQLDAAAASPAGQKVAAALQAARKQVQAAAASPAGQRAGAALQTARAALRATWHAACRQLAAARASPLGQRAEAALARLPPVASLPELAREQLAAVAATPVGRRALAVLDRLPPLASLLLLDLSLVGAAAAAMAAAPGLVHSTVSRPGGEVLSTLPWGAAGPICWRKRCVQGAQLPPAPFALPCCASPCDRSCHAGLPCAG